VTGVVGCVGRAESYEVVVAVMQSSAALLVEATVSSVRGC